MHLGKMQRCVRVGSERVARICPPDVCADRAPQAGAVLVVVEEIVLRIILASIGLLGDQRVAVLPPAEQACGNPIVGLSDFLGYIGNKGVEGRDILFELAKHEIGAVPPDIPIMPVGDARLALVLVTKQEFARLYLGARLDLGFSISGIGVFAFFRAALDLRLGKAVLKAEVLLLFGKELTPKYDWLAVYNAGQCIHFVLDQLIDFCLHREQHEEPVDFAGVLIPAAPIPLLWRTVFEVAKNVCPAGYRRPRGARGSHSFEEFEREGVKRGLVDPEMPQARGRQRQISGGLRLAAGPGLGWRQPPPRQQVGKPLSVAREIIGLEAPQQIGRAL